MIITRLKIDNLYGFQNFELDLTYPRKHSQSFVDYEYLEKVPKFKFKRVCILMGTNASGKTSLGKVLWGIQYFIINGGDIKKIPEHFKEVICDKNKPAQITIEFVYPHNKVLQYLHMEFKSDGTIINIHTSELFLQEEDTNLTAQARLEKQKALDLVDTYEDLFSSETDKCSEKLNKPWAAPFNGFYYAFAENHSNDFYIGKHLKAEDLNKLLLILKTFDPTIVDVSPLKTEKKDGDSVFEGYTVFFQNGDSVKVTDNGETFNTKGKNRFSKGTYDVLSVADFILFILRNSADNHSSTYFLDEKLSSSHSELEMTILNLIIQKLNKHSQFFYTTHNYDVLDLNLPAHSFVFLNKENGYCQAEQPEKLGFSKNDRKLKGYVRNNYFRTIPSTHLLDELMWGEDDE